MGGISGALLFIILSLLYSFGLLLLNTSSTPSTFLDDILFSTRLAENYHRPRPPHHPHHICHYGLRLKALSRLPTRLHPRSHRNHTFYKERYVKRNPFVSNNDQWDCEHTPLAQCMDSYHRWVHTESHLLGLDTMFPSFADLEFLASTNGTQKDDLAFHHDPLRQFKTIQLLCGGCFLETTYKRKETRWKPFPQQCMVAAATFSQTNDFSSVMRLMDSTYIPNFADLSKRMLIYLNGNGDDLLPIVIDSGASCSLTHNKHDFIGDIRPATINKLRGLSNTTKVLGVGTVEWTIRDVFGAVRTLKTEAYYIPEANIRLFSPQMYFHEQQKGQLVMNHSSTTLCLADGSTLVFPYNSQSNLPLMLPTPTRTVGLTFEDACVLGDGFSARTFMSVADETNQNLTASQKELLIWYWKLGHANFQWIQTLCRHSNSDSKRCVLPTRFNKTSSCPAPKCAACMLGKQARRTPTLSIGHQLLNKDLLLKTNHLRPGDCVSLDQYQSSIPGHLEHTYGKETKDERYTGGTIFVDHASGLMYLKHQVSLRVGETLKAKYAFEQMARDFSVSIKKYHADNMPFGNGDFVRSVEDSGQPIKFSGVGAHHQNGVAERAIQTMSSWARTMLLHATIHWPEAEHLHLWPLALQHAAYLWNHLPNRTTGVAPIEIFSGVSFSTFEHLTSSHVWGCPVYVLDPKLQDGKKLPKWQARARHGQYLGISPDHSSTVGLIHNLRTGFISPQYHVIYDDLFSSIPNAESGGLPHDPEFTGEFWRRLIETGLESVLPDDDEDPVPPLHPDWLTDTERAARRRDHDAHRLHLDPLIRPSVDGGTTMPINASNQPRSSAPEGADMPEGTPAPEGAPITDDLDDADEVIFADSTEDDNNASLSSTTSDNDSATVCRRDHLSAPDPETHGRGKRQRKPNRNIFDERLWANTASFPRGSSYPKQKVLRVQLNSQFLQSLSWEQAMDTIKSIDLRRMEHVLLQNTNPYTNTIEEMHPMALSTKANAADHPTWEQAMNGPEAKGYWEASKKELNTLKTKCDAWEVVQRQPWMRVLPSTWAFRCKRYPDGSVRKLKARFCARGDKQIEGVDCFDTFAPVVNWTTVRLMLILTLILNLATCQVDYTAAFVHAPIDTDVYLDMPRGFAEPNKVYRLKRSLYGLRQSPRNFFQHLKSKLEAVGL